MKDRLTTPTTRCLIVIASAAFGLAAGVAIHVVHAHRIKALSPPDLISENVAASPRKTATSRSAGGLSPLAARLESDLASSAGVTRWLHWLGALEQATPQDFPSLARLARGNATALRFLGARWVALAPRHLFDTLVANVRTGGEPPDYDLVSALFTEWTKRDPEAVIAALTEGDDFGMRDYWRFQAAYALIDTDVERAMRLMAEWNVETTGFGPRGIKAVSKWTAANPQHAAEFVMEQPAGYAEVTAMEAVGEQWARMDPAGAMAFAARTRGDLGATLAYTALNEWANRDPAAASQWLASTDPRTRSRLSETLTQAWAKQDAPAALAWCEQNLAGSALSRAVAGVVSGAAEKNVASAAELVTSMEPSLARAEAAGAMAQKWFPGMSSGKTVPPEAIAWLGGLDGDSLRRAIETVTWGWATCEPRTMASFLARTPNDQVPPNAYRVVARELARNNPSEALQWAAELSPAQGVIAGTSAFSEWRLSQQEAADKWLNELPSSDPRRQPFVEATVRELAYHPQGAEQLAAMPQAQRAIVRSVLESMDLEPDRRAALLKVLK